MKIVVYSAIFGNKDEIKEIEPQYLADNVDALMFTDNKNLKSKSFRVIHVKPRFSDSPHLSSRYYKILPHRFMNAFNQYGCSLWIDGNRRLTCDPNILLKSINKNPIAVGTHHRTEKRDAYDEAEHCIKLRKDDPKKIKAQVNFYKSEGMPKKFGLWGCPIMLRNHNDQRCINFCERWWDELLLRSKRDQISFPYVVWKTGRIPAQLPKGLRITEKFKHTG
jgi:hypothetical protein